MAESSKNKSVDVKDIKSSRSEAMNKFYSDIDKKFGKGSVMDAGTSVIVEKAKCIKTGSIGLDVILGCGGYPEGRVIEIYGAESSGKTTLSLHAVVEAQIEHPDKHAGFIDMEHALDLNYASSIGVDRNRLSISQPDFGEQALDIAEEMIQSGLFSIVVIDSVAALVPKTELDGEMGDAHVGQHARLMSQALRKLTSKISKSGTLVVFINQQREKIGIMFGSPLTTTGGNALKFYSSVRLEVSRVGQNKDGEIITGNKTKVKVVKNKMASPFKTCQFDIVFGKGISKLGEIVDYGSELGVITKSGSWYSYHETKLGQGRDSVISLLADNPDLTDELEVQVKAKMGTIEFEVKQ